VGGDGCRENETLREEWENRIGADLCDGDISPAVEEGTVRTLWAVTALGEWNFACTYDGHCYTTTAIQRYRHHLAPPPMTRPVNRDSRRDGVTHRQTDLRHDDTIRDRSSSCAADTRINIHVLLYILLKYE